MTIAGGRTVGYYEWGDPAGFVVFALHGTPACGAGFAFVDGAAHAAGVRVIAPDRPGIGLSDPMPRRPVRGYAGELAAIADALGIDTFSVLGYSGGGPFACAVAHGLGSRVRGVGVVGGAGNISEWARIDEAEATDRFFMMTAPRLPYIARVLLRSSAIAARMSPRIALRTFERELPAADRKVLASLDDPSIVTAMFTEAFRRGARGVVDDYAAIARPWGFDVSEIDHDLQVWQGAADTVVPMRHAEALAARVPNAQLTVWPREGHLGLVGHIDEILEALTCV